MLNDRGWRSECDAKCHHVLKSPDDLQTDRSVTVWYCVPIRGRGSMCAAIDVRPRRSSLNLPAHGCQVAAMAHQAGAVDAGRTSLRIATLSPFRSLILDHSFDRLKLLGRLEYKGLHQVP